MQPGTNSEDIHTILSRFNHWAGNETQNGNGHMKELKGLDEGVHEIPYEEAMHLMRSRKAGSAPSLAPMQPAIEAALPSAVRKAVPEKQMRAAPPETAVPGIDSAEKHGPRSKSAAKKASEAKVAKAEEHKPAARRARRDLRQSSQAESPQEFRQVLAKSVRNAKPAAKLARSSDKGRDQRVSVRLSRAEEHRLQARAAKAGVTISEYLRMRALETETTPTPSRSGVTAATFHEQRAVAAPPEPAKQPRTGLGDWITLLRNRFLSSPQRFAERA